MVAAIVYEHRVSEVSPWRDRMLCECGATLVASPAHGAYVAGRGSNHPHIPYEATRADADGYYPEFDVERVEDGEAATEARRNHADRREAVLQAAGVDIGPVYRPPESEKVYADPTLVWREALTFEQSRLLDAATSGIPSHRGKEKSREFAARIKSTRKHGGSFSISPEGRRIRRLKQRVAAGEFATLAEAEAAVPRRGRLRKDD